MALFLALAAFLPPPFIKQANAAKPNLPDLDVLFIERLPRFDFDAAKKWPIQGELVEFKAHIKNNGTQPTGQFDYEWKVDSSQANSGNSPSLAPRQETTISYRWPWNHTTSADERIQGSHTIELTVDPESSIQEISENNNKVTDFTQALAVGFWVEQAVYDFFNTNQYDYCQGKTCSGSNSWEDWAQRQIREWNKIFAKSTYPSAPNGVLDKVRLDKVAIVNNCELPLDSFHHPRVTVDGDKNTPGYVWRTAGYPYGVEPGNWWQVDLGQATVINHIVVWPNAENYSDWMRKFRIEGSTTGAFNGEQIILAREDNWPSVHSPDIQSRTYNFPEQNVRFVRIISETTQIWVQLQEVEIFSTAGANVALHKNASAVSWELSGSADNQPDKKDRTVDMMWGFTSAKTGVIACARDEADGNKRLYQNNPGFQNVEYPLMHELSHARYLIDTYCLTVNGNDVLVKDESGNLIAGTSALPYVSGRAVHLNSDQKMMGGGVYEEGYGEHSVGALNRIQGLRARGGNYNAPSTFGEYLRDLPLANKFQILSAEGSPLPNATISVYRAASAPGYCVKNYVDSPDITSTTDERGMITFGRNLFAPEKMPVTGSNSVVLLKIVLKDKTDYVFQEVTDLNLAYWSGDRFGTQAIHAIYTDISTRSRLLDFCNTFREGECPPAISAQGFNFLSENFDQLMGNNDDLFDLYPDETIDERDLNAILLGLESP